MTTLRKRILTFTQNLFLNNIGIDVKFLHLKTMRNLAIMLFSALFFSCEDPTAILINTSNTGGQVATIFTDTVKVASSSLLLDSTFTSGQAGGVVGRYKDPLLGEVSAKTFTEISLPLLNTDVFTTLKFPAADSGITVYDSVYVFFAHNGFAYGDSTKDYNLTLHRLTQSFDKTRYTNEDVMTYDPTPMASKTFTYKELKRANSTVQDSLISMKLPKSLGEEIYKLFYTESGSTIEKFTAAVKGIALVSNQTAQNVYGISLAGSYIQLYYHTTTSTDRKSIPLTFYSKRFSQIQGNRAGTVLQNLKKLQPISSSLTSNRAYLQSGIGISPKINFPSLSAFATSGSLIVNKAELVIEADLDQITGNYPVPAQVSLVHLDNENRLRKTSTGLIDFVGLDGLTGTQYTASYNKTTNSYSFNFTSLLQDLINKKQTNNGLAIVPSLLNTTTSTISVYNSNVSRLVVKNIKLNVYYSTKK